jgi:tRNA (cmo5U34)-methyltransferase
LDDPIARHPTRAEQLDVLVAAIDDIAQVNGGQINALDLGCGTGYVPHLLLARDIPVTITGVDLSPDSLAKATEALSPWPGRFQGLVADLGTPEKISLPVQQFDVIYSCLTFHDLSDDQKQGVIRWATQHLAPGGVLFIYDRLRLTSRRLFPVQLSIWRRIEATTGVAMRTSPDFDTYIEDLGSDNTPAALSSYLSWFAELGCEATVVHLHGNIALLAATGAD